MSGVLLPKLRLQFGCPVILLRNVSAGLAKRTRLMVKPRMVNFMVNFW